MTDTELSERDESLVREAVTARMETVSDERLAQLLAHHYHPRQYRIGRWPTVGAVAATLGMTAGILVAALSTGASSAFAGWTPVPAAASPAAVAQARATCADVPAAAVVASETRGPYTAIVYTRNGNPWQCVVKGGQTLLNKGTEYPLKIVVRPTTGRVSLPMFNHTAKGLAGRQATLLSPRLQHLLRQSPTPLGQIQRVEKQLFAAETGTSSLAAASGYVGSGVTGVTFVLRDGLHVKATVGNGWYLAWWPGSSRPSAHYPVTVLVTTKTGTAAAQFTIPPFDRPAALANYYRPTLCRGCGPRTPIPIVPGVAAVITRSYQLFRTPPTPVRRLPLWLQPVIRKLAERPVVAANPQLGLDLSQTRVVLVNRDHAVILVPGREGLCTMVADPGGGGGSCEPKHAIGRSIDGEFGSESGPNMPYGSDASGVVPDGFSHVVVHLASGQTRAVPVHDNAFRGIFKQPVTGVSARNAAGKVIH
jgi:hypothetical protein